MTLSGTAARRRICHWCFDAEEEVATIKNEMEIGYKENGKRMGRKGKKKKKNNIASVCVCV